MAGQQRRSAPVQIYFLVLSNWVLVKMSFKTTNINPTLTSRPMKLTGRRMLADRDSGIMVKRAATPNAKPIANRQYIFSKVDMADKPD
jgi:hypothetical protein